MKITKKLIKPILTEKSVKDNAADKYTFAFAADVSKNFIKNHIEELFNVTVVSVNTSVIPGKTKRLGKTRKLEKKSKWKKAVVALKAGQKIDLTSGGSK